MVDTTLTPDQVAELSDEAREELLASLLGDTGMKAVEAFRSNEESKARNKRIRSAARVLCGAVEGVDGDEKYSKPYEKAKKAMEDVFESARKVAQAAIFKTDGLDSNGKPIVEDSSSDDD